MKFTLKRLNYRADGIFGILLGEKNTNLFSTLEHAYPATDLIGTSISKIPLGTYTAVRYKSPKFGCDVWRLIGVPGHDFIEIHWGNFNIDSEGCILLGTHTGQNSNGTWILSSSKIAFASFMKLTQGLDTIEITITQ